MTAFFITVFRAKKIRARWPNACQLVAINGDPTDKRMIYIGCAFMRTLINTLLSA